MSTQSTSAKLHRTSICVSGFSYTFRYAYQIHRKVFSIYGEGGLRLFPEEPAQSPNFQQCLPDDNGNNCNVRGKRIVNKEDENTDDALSALTKSDNKVDVKVVKVILLQVNVTYL